MDENSKVSKVNLFEKTPVKSNPFDQSFEQGLTQSAFNPAKKRINDYDSSILDNNSYMEFDDETVKLEYKITEKEKELGELREKILGAEKIAKVNEVIEMRIREKGLEKELSDLNKAYSEKGITTKVNKLVKNPDGNFVIMSKIQKFISRKILPLVSKKFEKISQLSLSLDTLQSINHNIDELIEMKVPYGEYNQNYEKLTAYLNRANKIHAQITKSMGKIK